MIKSGIIKPVLLLALIGIIVTALVQPIAGSTMGQGNMMEQKDKMVSCSDNKSMMQSGMGECAESKMCETPSKEMTMDSMMMGEKACNETMMDSMIACANPCLEKAIKIHEMHLMNPSTATRESQQEMMDQMMQANKYLTGKKAIIDMMNKKGGYASAEYEQPYVISAQTRLNLCSLWLGKAMKLHEMHLKNPETATDESQMRLMANMMRAKKYLAGEGMNMEMAKNASLPQENVDLTTLWLKKAMILHAMDLKRPEAATDESQMRLMNQMVRARECLEGKDLDLEMMMDFEEDSASEMCEPSSSEMCEPSPREKMMCAMMMDSMRMGEKSCNETMKSSMMEEIEAKKEKMESMMEEKEAKKEKMESMMEEKEAKKEKMESMMEEKEAKKEKLESMMEEKLANESCYTGKMGQKVGLTQANMECICLCLEKAMKLHEMHMRTPETATKESKMEMMKQMMQAHEYLTGEKMNMDMMNRAEDMQAREYLTGAKTNIDMMNRAEDGKSAEWLKETADCLSTGKNEKC